MGKVYSVLEYNFVSDALFEMKKASIACNTLAHDKMDF